MKAKTVSPEGGTPGVPGPRAEDNLFKVPSGAHPPLLSLKLPIYLRVQDQMSDPDES